MKKNSIWITGAAGKLGSELVALLSQNVENKIVATDIDVDITDTREVMQHAEIYRPTVIINCASLSDAEYCESHMVEAFKVNALGARNLATAARHVNAKIIQLSTDDVFDGNLQGTRTEFDTPSPTTVYGKSKLAGENYVRELTSKHLIIRSSWVYGLGKKDYFSEVCKYGENNTSFNAPNDSFGTPTSAKELAKFIETMIDETEYGIYHASCEGQCSRADYARMILEKMGYDTNLVVGFNKYPDGKSNSTVLENLMMKMTEVYEMPDYIFCLDEYIQNMK